MKITFQPDKWQPHGMMRVEAENDNERAILRVFLDGGKNGYNLVIHNSGGKVATSHKGDDEFTFGWRKLNEAATKQGERP